MPYTSQQWRAIAAQYMRKYGEAETKRRLHKLKAEATKGGHPLIVAANRKKKR
jgi:murein endopeptidase